MPAEAFSLDALTASSSSVSDAVSGFAFIEYHVLCFRDQHLDHNQQIAFSEQFGTLERHMAMNRGTVHPLVHIVTNLGADGRPTGKVASTQWHSDKSFRPQPSLATILHALVMPPEGGETCFANMIAAYEALPEDLRQKITGMKTENTLVSSARFKLQNPDIVREQLESKTPPTVQPLVRTHPETGKKAVWFHKGKTERIIGMTPEETQEFLQDLTDRITQPQFCYAHQYQKGDLLIIDDRQSLHKAGFDFDHSQQRRLYRMLVRGDRPF